MEPGCYLSDNTLVPASSVPEFEALGGNQIWSNLVKAYTDRTGPICWNPTIRYGFLSLLLALQVIMLMWFATIASIVYKVVRGENAEDARSDDEDEGEVEGETTVVINVAKSGVEFAAPVEQEVGVEAINFTRKSSPSGGVRPYKKQTRRSSGRASGISIPGHGDRKELLGRIGCDKPT